MKLPKTLKISLSEIGSWQNVSLAFYQAMKGKTKKAAIQQALKNPEETIRSICFALRQGYLPKGEFKAFTIHDPKKREIHAAPFVDRVAHHALIHILEPTFERLLLPSVFACRSGYGVHKAITYAQQQSRRYAWVMHLDIKHYFPNIDHNILKKQLSRYFKGDGFLILKATIDAYGKDKNQGLPIGALSSQHFANHYLAQADRWCLAQKEIKAHCRYMDDFLLWANSKQNLMQFLERFKAYLAHTLKLTLKPALIKQANKGVLFCGIKIKPFALHASKRRKRRYRTARMQWEQAFARGIISSLQLQQVYASIKGILLPADEALFRAFDCSKNGVVDA